MWVQVLIVIVHIGKLDIKIVNRGKCYKYECVLFFFFKLLTYSDNEQLT